MIKLPLFTALMKSLFRPSFYVLVLVGFTNFSFGQWTTLPGRAKDIGVNANGAAWVIGSDEGIYYWNGSAWVKTDGVAVKIAVDPLGNPWVVNAAGNIYSRRNNEWIQMPGGAKDIGIGANGSVWITGTDSGIYLWNGSDWSRIDGAAVRLSVDASGNPWVVNSDGGIYRRINNTWAQLPGAAIDIGVGANGAAWVIGLSTDNNGNGVFRWTGSDWQQVDGAAIAVTVDGNGNPWVVNANGEIFKRTGNGGGGISHPANQISTVLQTVQPSWIEAPVPEKYYGVWKMYAPGMGINDTVISGQSVMFGASNCQIVKSYMLDGITKIVVSFNSYFLVLYIKDRTGGIGGGGISINDTNSQAFRSQQEATNLPMPSFTIQGYR